MKRSNMHIPRWEIFLGIGLVVMSVVIYACHYALFHDAHHIFIYLVGDLGFLPIEILLVTLIVHRLLNVQEKKNMLSKLNMVIGAFFSEVGTELIRHLVVFDRHLSELRKNVVIGKEWNASDFRRARRYIQAYTSEFDYAVEDLAAVKSFLQERRGFLLGLLENPVLLEHKSFSNLLWATFHLVDELIYRKDLTILPPEDVQHIMRDMGRVYTQLISEWLDYMHHVQKNYPYLFSMATRLNPFESIETVVIEQ